MGWVKVNIAVFLKEARASRVSFVMDNHHGVIIGAGVICLDDHTVPLAKLQAAWEVLGWCS